MMRESGSIQEALQSARLDYAVMKGASLVPFSVPQLELRHQFDLDFLMAEHHAEKARKILEEQGYRLFAISGRTWEFKKGETPHVSASDLYKDLPYRGVELHLESTDGEHSRLSRVVMRNIGGINTPVLSKVDILIGQAKHLLKDLKGPFVRGSHLLELRRHFLSLNEADENFWQELRSRLQRVSHERLSIAVASQLLTKLFGDSSLDALDDCMYVSLPVSVWLQMYGARSFLSSPPGTKLGSLLDELVRNETHITEPSARAMRSLRLPPAVIRAVPGESLGTRGRRYWVQVRYVASRVLFHGREAARLTVEQRRWHRTLGEQR
jgi:hypothetical protein